MTILSGEAANLFESMGVTRVVPARELSISQIAKCREKTKLELEVFVHGALCYCYSGQCLMSEVVGGRSGNRGMCAQPCRLPYEVEGKKGYFLSPKDVCTIENIPDLVDAGIDSFKIEGRMKRKEYAALTTVLYRKYVDFYQSEGRSEFEKASMNPNHPIHKDIKKLMDIYNRGGFCGGYLFEKNRADIMDPVKNNHYGLKVGTVTSVSSRGANIQFCEDVEYQDVLEFRNEDGTKEYEYTIKNPVKAGLEDHTNVIKGSRIFKGQNVFRTKNATLLDKLNALPERNITLYGQMTAEIGKPAILHVWNELGDATVQGATVMAAQNRPVTMEDVTKRLERMGETYFSWGDLQVQVEEGAFLPLGKVNELRRDALNAWEEKVNGQYCREKVHQTKLPSVQENENEEIMVSVCNIAQLELALKSKATAIHCKLEFFQKSQWNELMHLFEKFDGDRYISFPRIMLLEDMPHIDDINIKILVNSWEALCYAIRENRDFSMDENMYETNTVALAFYKKMGAGTRYKTVYGCIPVMTTAGCVRRTMGECHHETNPVRIKNDRGDEFLVVNHCDYCYNTIYTVSPKEIIGSYGEVGEEYKHKRLNLFNEDDKETKRILEKWKI
jgi:putative protease